MEKTGDIKSGHTPDTENKLTEGEKQASEDAKRDALDDDFTKRAADQVTEKLS